MRRELDRVEARRRLGPHEQNLTGCVIQDEPGARTEALGLQARPAVARENEQVCAGARLQHLALDLPPARVDLSRSREPAPGRLQQRLRLFLGDDPQRWAMGRRWMAAEQASAAPGSELLYLARRHVQQRDLS